MCGLCGVVIGEKASRRVAEIDGVVDTFIRLLLGSERRGPHATGVAWVKRDGAMQVAKEPLPARTFLQSETFIDWLIGVDRQVTYLMGHTRWPSLGSIHNPENNHPLSLSVSTGQALAVTHNGTLTAVQQHFKRLRLPRTAQVDSELLARITQRHTHACGIDLDAVLADFQPLDGRMSLALVATTNPEEIILLKGNMPLEIRLHPRSRVLLYASEARILDQAMASYAGWETFPLASGTGLIINTHTWTLRQVPFTFRGITSHIGNSYTGASRKKEQNA